jgi:hypothetical protein
VQGFDVKVRQEGEVWVAQVQPGGPDVTTQGPDAIEALWRLADTLNAEARSRPGGLNDIPKW